MLNHVVSVEVFKLKKVTNCVYLCICILRVFYVYYYGMQLVINCKFAYSCIYVFNCTVSDCVLRLLMYLHLHNVPFSAVGAGFYIV